MIAEATNSDKGMVFLDKKGLNILYIEVGLMNAGGCLHLIDIGVELHEERKLDLEETMMINMFKDKNLTSKFFFIEIS